MDKENISKEIIDLYINGHSLRDLSKKYNKDRRTIKKILLYNNIKLKTLSEANRTYSFNEHIFNNIDSHEKAYWLGFIAADGSIFKNTLKIGLSAKDINHLDKFKKFLNSTHPIKIFNPVIKNKKYSSCEFSINSDILVNDLKKHEILNKKSKILNPAKINEEFLNSYILGIVDGDGCFSVDKKNQIKLNVISSLSMCEFIMEIFVKNTGITKTKIVAEKRSAGMYYCYFGGNKKIKNIIDFLYKNKITYLERKYNIVKNHFKI